MSKAQGMDLLSGEQVRPLFQQHDSSYGADFEPEEWERIAYRVSALTRLMYRMYARRQREGTLDDQIKVTSRRTVLPGSLR